MDDDETNIRNDIASQDADVRTPLNAHDKLSIEKDIAAYMNKEKMKTTPPKPTLLSLEKPRKTNSTPEMPKFKSSVHRELKF